MEKQVLVAVKEKRGCSIWGAYQMFQYNISATLWSPNGIVLRGGSSSASSPYGCSKCRRRT